MRASRRPLDTGAREPYIVDRMDAYRLTTLGNAAARAFGPVAYAPWERTAG